jgi:hypothetical protein
MGVLELSFRGKGSIKGYVKVFATHYFGKGLLFDEMQKNVCSFVLSRKKSL